MQNPLALDDTGVKAMLTRRFSAEALVAAKTFLSSIEAEHSILLDARGTSQERIAKSAKREALILNELDELKAFDAAPLIADVAAQLESSSIPFQVSADNLQVAREQVQAKLSALAQLKKTSEENLPAELRPQVTVAFEKHEAALGVLLARISTVNETVTRYSTRAQQLQEELDRLTSEMDATKDDAREIECTSLFAENLASLLRALPDGRRGDGGMVTPSVPLRKREGFMEPMAKLLLKPDDDRPLDEEPTAELTAEPTAEPVAEPVAEPRSRAGSRESIAFTSALPYAKETTGARQRSSSVSSYTKEPSSDDENDRDIQEALSSDFDDFFDEEVQEVTAAQKPCEESPKRARVSEEPPKKKKKAKSEDKQMKPLRAETIDLTTSDVGRLFKVLREGHGLEPGNKMKGLSCLVTVYESMQADTLHRCGFCLEEFGPQFCRPFTDHGVECQKHVYHPKCMAFLTLHAGGKELFYGEKGRKFSACEVCDRERKERKKGKENNCKGHGPCICCQHSG